MIKNKYLKIFMFALLLTLSLGLSGITKNIASADITSYTMTEVSNGQTLTTENEVTIGSSEELGLFATYVNSGNDVEGITFKLVSNIDLEGSDTNKFTPIGTSEYVFNGNFDGQNYTISNLYIEGESNVGLFSYVKDSVIKNFNIENATIIGNDYVASVGAYIEFSTLQNISVNNASIDGKKYVGGIAGYLKSNIDGGISTIENSSFSGLVQGIYNVAGICGYAISNSLTHPSTLINCKNLADIDYSVTKEEYDVYREAEYIGGICGYGYNPKFLNCENYGKIFINESSEIIKKAESIGGICGKVDDDGIVENCKNYGNIVGFNCTGGIVGYTDGYDITINYSENYGDITGSNYVGGIVGKCETDVLNSKNAGNIYTQEFYYYSKNTTTNEYQAIQNDYSKQSSHVGGICGLMQGNIYTSINLGSITVNNTLTSNSIGGMVGTMYGEMKNSYNKGNIFAKANNVGGLCGSLIPQINYNSKYEDTDDDGESDFITYYETVKSIAGVYNCYATCKILAIESLDIVGGLVGYNRDGNLVNCYFAGLLEGTTKNNIVGKVEIDEKVAVNIPDSMYSIINETVETTTEKTVITVFEDASCIIKNLYYEKNELKAINNLDDEENEILGLSLSQICSNDEGSLSEKLNVYVNDNKGYKFWKYEQDYPVLYTKVFKVVYDLYGGDGSVVDTNEYLVNDVVSVNFSTIPTKQNHSFVGYILNDDETNIFMPYDDVEDTFVILQELNTLKAVWKLNVIENISYSQEQTYDYVSGITHSLLVLGQNETDNITYSTDGINYVSENFAYEKPGEYTIFFKIERENYVDYLGKAKITINKIDLDISNAVWIREWFEDYIQVQRQEVIANNEFYYNSYENTIVLNEANLPSEIQSFSYGANKVKNSGNYTIVATLEFDDTIYNCEKYLKIDLSVNKIVVNKPQLEGDTSFVYSGLEQFINVDNSVENDKYYYNILNNSGTTVGNYEVVAELRDKLNYVWSDNTINNITFSFNITPKLLLKPSLSDKQEKTSLTINYDESNHILEFYNLSDELTVLNNKERKNVGKYEVSVILNDTLNYNWIDGTITPLAYILEINPKEISIPQGGIGLNEEIVEYEHIFTFNNQVQGVDISSTNDYIVLNNGAISAGSYKALLSLLDKHNTVWVGGSTEDLVIPYLINKIKVSKPVNQNRFIYNGLEQTFELPQNANYIVSNNKRTLAGEQVVIVSLIDKNNTCWNDESIEDLLLNFVIEKAKMPSIDSSLITKELVKGKVITNIEEYILKGAKLSYSLTIDGEYLDEIEITKDGEYTVYYKIEKENYETISGQFKITKESDQMIFDNLNAIFLYLAIILVVILIIGIIIIFVVKKVKIKDLFDKNKNLKQVVNEEKQKEIEELDVNIEKQEVVEKQKVDNEKLKAHYDEEILMLEEKYKNQPKQKSTTKSTTKKTNKSVEETKNSVKDNIEEKNDNKKVEDDKKEVKENTEIKSNSAKKSNSTSKSSSTKLSSKTTTQTKVDDEKNKTKKTTTSTKTTKPKTTSTNKSAAKTSTAKTANKQSEKQENKD